MPTQQSISLQAGLSIQRVVPLKSSACPCPTLSNKKYTNEDLSRRPFVNMTMLNHEFLECMLTRTNFTKSILATFLFQTCQGESTTFTQVNMSDGCLSQCEFDKAVWINSFLQHLRFSDVNMPFNIFTDANLNFVDFNKCTMLRCAFDDSTLRNTQFCEIEIEDVENRMSFDSAKLFVCEFQKCKLNEIECIDTKFHECKMIENEFRVGNFENANFLDSVMDNCDFSESNFSGASLTQCSFINCNLENADFSEAELNETIIDSDTLMNDIIFSGAKLNEIEWIDIQSFDKARFDGASFYKCVLDNSKMFNLNFITAHFAETSLKGTILGQDEEEFSDFTEATFDTIETDENTRFDYCDFSKAEFTNVKLDQISMANCKCNHTQWSQVDFLGGVICTDSTFHHSTWANATFDADSNLQGVSFIDSEMDNVVFQGANLDGVVFDESKLYNMDFTVVSLIGTSFVGTTLSDVDFTDATLSLEEENAENDAAQVATQFQKAKLTRAIFTGENADLRFVLFSESTLTMCTFEGTTDYILLNLSDANFDDSTIADTTFTQCDLTNATFANSTIIRCKFNGCSMSEMDTDNVKLENCTADRKTILPPNWMRDSNGWIILQDPGPVPEEEAQNEIMDLGKFGDDQFRSIQVIQETLENGNFIVSWFDGGPSAETSALHKMSIAQPESYKINDPVFVRVVNDEEYGDNYYVHGKIKSKEDDGTYNVDYYLNNDISPNQMYEDIFPEYFEDGQEGYVAIYDKQYFRLIEQITESTSTWSDGSTTTKTRVFWFDGTSSKVKDTDILKFHSINPFRFKKTMRCLYWFPQII